MNCFELFGHVTGVDPFLIGAKMMIIFGAIFIVLLVTITKRWKWVWKEWLTSLDPKRIGVMYLVVAFLMLIRAVIDAVMMRGQQAMASGGSNGVLDANHFQQVFTAHGTLMIIFVAMGLMFGLMNLIIPLQIGSRDVAFPLLNSISFWLYVAGVVLINLSLVIGGEFSIAGWLAYPPLSGIEFSPGPGVDYWIWCVQISGLGSLLSGINFLQLL